MIRFILVACVGLGLALIALLFRASSNNTLFSEHYPWLFGMGLALAGGLLALIGYQVWSLLAKVRSQVFGARLASRLMLLFAMMAIIPGTLVYAISVQFLDRSIDTWFDVPVDRALAAGLNLGRKALAGEQLELLSRAHLIGESIAAQSAPGANLTRVLAEQKLVAIATYDTNGKLHDSATRAEGVPRSLLDKPTPGELRDAEHGPVQAVETVSEGSVLLRVLLLVPSRSGTPILLHLVTEASKSIVTDAQSVDAGFREYQQLGFQRSGLKRLFALTLTLALLLTLFSAIALSFLLSERLSAPLSALAESTRAIARGDFTRLNPVKSRDEFGVLTQSFNTMTRQLGEASDVVARKQRELEDANTYLEAILGHLTSGVITLDQHTCAKSVNKKAEEMLGFEQVKIRGTPLSAWADAQPQLKPLVEAINLQVVSGRDRPWQRQISYDAPTGKLTLLVRATRLPTQIEGGFILVIDDITGLIQAQRDAAWGEVARRLAHEIKNPLTPIQLSAERLEMKLAATLPSAERELLVRSTRTIVAQVNALKGMVDDFSIYSRSARLTPAAFELNALISEVLVLYESMNVELVHDADATIPTLTGDPALLRQVLHNLVQNALDASAACAAPKVTVSTRKDEDEVVLAVEDNGNGVREELLTRIFEPYVTTKPKGTGLGLAIVKKIVDEHGGRVSITNLVPHGARVEIRLPIRSNPPVRREPDRVPQS